MSNVVLLLIGRLYSAHRAPVLVVFYLLIAVACLALPTFLENCKATYLAQELKESPPPTKGPLSNGNKNVVVDQNNGTINQTNQ